MKETLKHLDPTTLGIHPVLASFPELSTEKRTVLADSIAEYGILDPLIAVEEDGKILVLAGRNRRRIAIEKHLETVPVIIRNGIAPLDFALEEAVVGRQLTKSGVALMIFEKHPALARTASTRTGGRPAKTADSIRGSETTESYKSLAGRYGFDEKYLRLLAELREGSDDEHWQLIRQAILEDEVSVTRCVAGQAGRSATAGAQRAQIDYANLCRRSLVSIKSSFQNWANIPFAEREELLGLWSEIQGLIPEDLKA